MAFRYDTALMAAYSTCGPTGLHQDPRAYRKCPAVHNILLHRGSPALRSRSQPEEDKVLHHPPPKETYCPPHITIGEREQRQNFQQFTYLGCTISSDAKIDKEVDNRLAEANSAFGRLYSRVWSSKHLKKATKCACAPDSSFGPYSRLRSKQF